VARSKFQNTTIAGGFALALAFLVPWLVRDEGMKLAAYQDFAKVWTICMGETSGVKKGDTKSETECDKILKSRAGYFMQQVYAKLNVTVTPMLLASHAHFAYNIGIGGYAKSETLKLTNQGKYIEGCLAMMNWYKSGGHDCRIDKGKRNGCYGMIVRRIGERDVCLSNIPIKGDQKRMPL